MSDQVPYDIMMLEDIQVSPEGDFVLAGLYESLTQDLEHWMDLGRSELNWDDSFFGDVKRYLSRQMTPSNIEAIRARAELFLSQDERVDTIEYVRIVPDTANHLVTVVAKVDGVELFAKLKE